MQTTHPVPPTDANYIQCDSLWYSAALCFSKIVPENSQDSQLWESNGDFVSPLTRGFCFSTEVFFFCWLWQFAFRRTPKCAPFDDSFMDWFKNYIEYQGLGQIVPFSSNPTFVLLQEWNSSLKNKQRQQSNGTQEYQSL